MSKIQKVEIDRWEVQLRKGTLDLAVLASLWPAPAYGLELLKRLESTANLVVPEGTIYPLLSRLKAEGLLTSKWEEAEAGHPRKYYSLTARGRKRVREMQGTWETFAGSLGQLLGPVREADRA